MPSYVYILASKTAGTLYIGMTNDLVRRVSEHKQGLVKGFTQRYNIIRPVWYEVHADIENAILREKRIKEWQRKWKIQLIEQTNPDWRDLFDKITGNSKHNGGLPGPLADLDSGLRRNDA